MSFECEKCGERTLECICRERLFSYEDKQIDQLKKELRYWIMKKMMNESDAFHKNASCDFFD